MKNTIKNKQKYILKLNYILKKNIIIKIFNIKQNQKRKYFNHEKRNRIKAFIRK